MARLSLAAGSTLVELLLALGIASILLPTLTTGIVVAREGRVYESQRMEANGLAREAEEALRVVRERGWSFIAMNGTFYPAPSGATWGLTPGTQTVNGYTRSVAIADARRDAGGALVTSGGTADPSTKQATITVAWTSPFPASVTSVIYLHRYLNDDSAIQTSQTSFSQGTRVNTVVTNISGGEVQLAVGTTISWAASTTVANYNAAGTEDATDVFTVGNYAYLSDSTTFTVLDMSTPSTPVFRDSLVVAGTIHHAYVSGNYAYLASASDTAELIVVNITNPADITQVATLNLTGAGDGRAVFVDGNYAYVSQTVATSTAREFTIVNVTTPTAPTAMGTLDLAGTIHNMKASGNYVFAATTLDAQELLVINVTNKSLPSVAGSYNATGTSDALDLGISSNNQTVYMGTAANTTGPEFYIINVANPATPALIDTHDPGSANVNGVSPSLNGPYVFLATSITNNEFIIMDITNPAATDAIGLVDLNAIAYDVRAFGDYALLATADNSREMIVMGPGSTPGGFQATGTFETSSFDAGASVGYNYLEFDVTQPANTSIRFQIATNTNDTTWNFVGPDGTGATYFNTPGAIPFNTINGRYIKMKAFFTSTGSATPVMSHVRVNYSL